MSNQEKKQMIEALLTQGIADAKVKKKAEAREKLERVIELDTHNEKAWFWLASVVDNDEERITCLQNVVLINPNNMRAFEILEKLEAKVEQGGGTTIASPDSENPTIEPFSQNVNADGTPQADAPPPKKPFTMAGLSPQASRMLLIGGGGALILAILLIVLLSATGDNPSDPTPTQAAARATDTPAPPTDTPAPTNTATHTPLPPSLTPTNTETPSPTPIPPAPPEANMGIMLVRSGSTLIDAFNQPMYMVSMADQSRFALLPDGARGRYASLSPDRQRVVYLEYNSTVRRDEAKISTLNRQTTMFLEETWGQRVYDVEHIDQTTWSSNGFYIAFVADPVSGGNGKNLFVLNLAASGGEQPFIEVQSQDNISDPNWSPDGNKVVFVADMSFAGGQGKDLRAFDYATGGIVNITTDTTLISESQPDWSPDGTKIVFSGEEQGIQGKHIYVTNADGTEGTEKLFEFGRNDINPQWSPDGKYIAFASDFGGRNDYDIFIYNVETKEFYRMTDDKDNGDFPIEWRN